MKSKLHKLVICIVLLCPSILGTRSHKVAVIGTGYVGSVLGACLASFNHQVICVDTNKETIAKLQRGEMTIYEPGLKELMGAATEKGTLSFSDNPAAAIQASDIIFIAVGTPMMDNGSADLTAIEAVAATIGKSLNGYKIICTKSTVPVGTGARIKQIILNASKGLYDFDIVSNPEFLREGSSIEDFLYPDRVILGVESERPSQTIRELYQPLIAQNVPFLFTNLESAELIKYASNAFLATKITFINEIAALCEKVGADVLQVAQGVGLDKRIGGQFLVPGPGYGGSCFPKDVQALLFKADQVAIDLKIARATKESNALLKKRIFEKLSHLLDQKIESKKIAVLGLAFKANTDDTRESVAIDILQNLIEQKASVVAYDPQAAVHMEKLFPHVTYTASPYEALKDADAVLILTEWKEFKELDLLRVKELLKKPVLLDARNIVDTTVLTELNFTFDNIGNATVKVPAKESRA